MRARRKARGRWRLRFVAGGAVLGFVIIHRDFKHVVAADADTVDFRARLLARFRLRSVLGVLALLRLAHGSILA
jgi:hypothetical protein